MRTVTMSFLCSVLFAVVIVQAEEPSAQLTPPIAVNITPKSDNENIDTAATNNWNQKYDEWKSLMGGNNKAPKDEAKAGQILTRLIEGVALVKLGRAKLVHSGITPRRVAGCD